MTLMFLERRKDLKTSCRIFLLHFLSIVVLVLEEMMEKNKVSSPPSFLRTANSNYLTMVISGYQKLRITLLLDGMLPVANVSAPGCIYRTKKPVTGFISSMHTLITRERKPGLKAAN